MLCSALKCILPLQTLTTKHKTSNDSFIRPYDLKEDLRCGFGSYCCFSNGIAEIDVSDEHKSWSFLSWLGVPGCTLPAVCWFIVSLAICWILVNTPVCSKSFGPLRNGADYDRSREWCSLVDTSFHTVHDMMFTLHDLPTGFTIDNSTKLKLAYDQNMSVQVRCSCHE